MKQKLGVKGLRSDDCRKNIVLTENKVTYRAYNKECKRILIYQVDGEMLDGGSRKCDKAFGLCDDGIIYFVELKGMDLRSACEQILQTINSLSAKIDGYVVHGRIVCTRLPRPDLMSTQVMRLERELRRRGGTFAKQSQIMEENL